MKPDITLILPTYNEVGTIKSLLEELLLLPFHEVLVADDNSPDGTGQIVLFMMKGYSKLSINFKERKGLGSAVRTAAASVKTPYSMVMDSDGQHSPKDAERLLGNFTGCEELVIGSRWLQGGNSPGLSWRRKLISRILTLYCNLRCQTKSSDPLSGMFIAKTHLVRNTTETGFKILYDILRDHKDLFIYEVPITLGYRKTGTSKASLKELWKVLKH